MNWQFNDGGREQAGFKGKTGDCVVRAIAICLQKPYKEIYEFVNKYENANSRTGVHKKVYKKIMKDLGFTWIPTMFIGKGCQVHLKPDELPKGRIIVRLSKHTCAVIDGVIQDTYDPSRQGNRCVYGYWSLTN